MKLFVVGINHRTAPVEIREKLSFGLEDIVEANCLLRQRLGLEEGLILSTCNRVEIYAVANIGHQDYINQIKYFLSQFHNINPLEFQDRLYVYRDNEAVKHLLKVASGLDSMVKGEAEILGQLKKAYHQAKESKATGKILNRLFQKTFNTAKKIRTDTFISHGLVSVSTVAVRLAKKILGDLYGKKVLIIGAGKVGEQSVLYLKKNGIDSILVTNRTFEKAQLLADNFGATSVRFEDLCQSLIDIDIIIASTSAPHCIIAQQDILSLMPKRKQKPIFIIDLAVPRDVEAEVNQIDNVYLYDIDDLQQIVDRNITLRENEVDNCNRIIDVSCQRFKDWLMYEEARTKK